MCHVSRVAYGKPPGVPICLDAPTVHEHGAVSETQLARALWNSVLNYPPSVMCRGVNCSAHMPSLSPPCLPPSPATPLPPTSLLGVAEEEELAHGDAAVELLEVRGQTRQQLQVGEKATDVRLHLLVGRKWRGGGRGERGRRESGEEEKGQVHTSRLGMENRGVRRGNWVTISRVGARAERKGTTLWCSCQDHPGML